MADWFIGQVPVPARSFGRPGDQIFERTEPHMKPDIHPQYTTTQVTCSCGSTFTTRSTAKGGEIHVETCSACHPFYTGKQRVLDTAGRVAKFQAKYAKVNAGKKK
jgi:large subunit ribosomal protein L31